MFKRHNISSFLIADECHRYGSKENRKIFNTFCDWTLGMSATPERFGDPKGTKVLYKNLGSIFYEYSYSQALRDRIISPFILINCFICLTEIEQNSYDRYSDTINELLSKLKLYYPELNEEIGSDDFYELLNRIEMEEENEYLIQLIKEFKKVVFRRREILYNAKYRFEAFKQLLREVYKDFRNSRIIIFHESIGNVEFIYDYLIKHNYSATIYHSKIPKNEKESNLYAFKRGLYNILVTCKALDEGLDVPNANVGIIVASTQSIRQRIQRLDRILRKSEGKKQVHIYTILVPELEFRLLHLDEYILGALNVKKLDFRKIFCQEDRPNFLF